MGTLEKDLSVCCGRVEVGTGGRGTGLRGRGVREEVHQGRL